MLKDCSAFNLHWTVSLQDTVTRIWMSGCLSILILYSTCCMFWCPLSGALTLLESQSSVPWKIFLDTEEKEETSEQWEVSPQGLVPSSPLVLKGAGWKLNLKWKNQYSITFTYLAKLDDVDSLRGRVLKQTPLCTTSLPVSQHVCCSRDNRETLTSTSFNMSVVYLESRAHGYSSWMLMILCSAGVLWLHCSKALTNEEHHVANYS